MVATKGPGMAALPVNPVQFGKSASRLRPRKGLSIWATHLMLPLVSSTLLAAPSSADFALVGNAGNPADNKSRGRVAYEFRIGRLEVTNAQYAEFLNAVASKRDPYQLYSALMTQHFWGGIERSGQTPRLSYAPKSGYEKLPVTFVSWWDAVRYANWLHYGRPTTGRSTLGTTEGDAEHGAYDTRDETVTVYRNSGARFWLPSHDEWLKAGFYDPNRADDGWWKYAQRRDHLPEAGLPDPHGVRANYYSDRWAAPYPHLVPVGSYPSATSYYGTFDQGGNVMEWVEDGNGRRRKMLGGSLFMPGFSLERGYVDGEFAQQELKALGFRVASLVEPGPCPTPPILREQNRERGESRPEQFMKFVTIREPGNEPDPLYGFGAVDYIFEMAKHEVTSAQYCAFLNAVARESDPYGLWHPDMQTGVVGGIDRASSPDGTYVYTPKPGWQHRPVTYISWYDLARMANWMHYGRPNTGKSGLGTTEGTAEQGAYDTKAFASPSEQPDYEAQPIRRNSDVTYWIPNQNEWYKRRLLGPHQIRAT